MRIVHWFSEGLSIRRTWTAFRIWAYRFFGLLFVTMILVSIHIPRYSGYLLKALEGPLVWDDAELLEYIRNEILEPPSWEPYNLLGEDNIALKGQDASEGFYREVLGELFKEKRNGFFVEAGALDGETMSNTLLLEKELGWTGLLVEPDEVNFKSLRTKNRKAWAANVCLSPQPYPSKEMLTQHIHYAGPHAVTLGFKTRAMHGLASYSTPKVLGNSWFAQVQCLPLESLLTSLNVTRIDLLVLDVEGAELDILKHFDLKKFDVQVLCMEWKTTEQLDDIAKEFEKDGYRKIAKKPEDLVLVKEGSPYMPKKPLILTEDPLPKNKNLEK